MFNEELWSLICTSITSLIFASSIALFINKWCQNFQYPVIRQKRFRARGEHREMPESKTCIHFSSSIAIYMFYVMVGFFLLLGVATPLIQKGIEDSMSFFDLAVVGIISVGVIRIITLISSVHTVNVIRNALILSFTVLIFLAGQSSADFQEIVNKISLNDNLSANPFIILPFLALIVAILTEAIWYSLIKFRKDQKATMSYINLLQSCEETETIGYLEQNIRKAYSDSVRTILNKEDVWEICWLGSYGLNDELYHTLIHEIGFTFAKKDNIPKGTYDNYSKEEISNYFAKSKLYLRTHGKFLLYGKAKPGLKLFKQNFGFAPGLVENDPPTRFLIINRKVLVTSWSAHHGRVYDKSNISYGSTMYNLSVDTRQITTYLNIIDCLWAESQMVKMGFAFGKYKDRNEYAKVLQILNRIKKPLMLNSLYKKCEEPCDFTKFQNIVEDFITDDLIIKRDDGSIIRDPVGLVWQNLWLDTLVSPSLNN